ncbi:MAG: hypothetical protein ACOZF0_21385 [Thermodesulfobacteriota bacterium]
MATLTFLRIGRMIHDELEECLAEHLLERQARGLKKLRRKGKIMVQAWIAGVVKWFGFGNLI